jgi:hypothetical protein
MNNLGRLKHLLKEWEYIPWELLQNIFIERHKYVSFLGDTANLYSLYNLRLKIILEKKELPVSGFPETVKALRNCKLNKIMVHGLYSVDSVIIAFTDAHITKLVGALGGSKEFLEV